MGRGLSDLQKRILKLALTHTRSRVPEDYWASTDDPERLYNHQIFEHLYGWQPGPLAMWQRTPTFKPDDIGTKAYRSAKVIVHKSCRRLESRGLVTIFDADFLNRKGIVLTPEGREIAEKIKLQV